VRLLAHAYCMHRGWRNFSMRIQLSTSNKEPSCSCEIPRQAGEIALKLAEGGIERIAEPVAEEIEREHRHQNSQARKERDPSGRGDVIPPLGDHRAPRWC
jgi:hypothetical protein